MTKEVIIIDAGGANFASIEAALQRLEVPSLVTSDPQRITQAERIILPGVGAAGHAMEVIHRKGLYKLIRSLKQPVLGICLGQQILCSSSEEDPVECLNIIPIKVKKLPNTVITPHMGWNNLASITTEDPFLHGMTPQDNFYFVHSFAPEVDPAYCLATCHYGREFAAIIKKENFYGVQFHPEKSGTAGVKMLKNFLTLTHE